MNILKHHIEKKKINNQWKELGCNITLMQEAMQKHFHREMMKSQEVREQKMRRRFQEELEVILQQKIVDLSNIGLMPIVPHPQSRSKIGDYLGISHR